MKQQIEAAAKWWAQQIFHTPMNWDNGDDSEAGGLAFLLGNMLKMQSLDKADDGAEARFIAALTKGIEAYQAERNGYLPPLCVDYAPDMILGAAAKEAGISPDAFPCKSRMSFRKDGSVWAACGYGKELECVYSPEKEISSQ